VVEPSPSDGDSFREKILRNRAQVFPDRIYTVSELTRLIKSELESAFPQPLWVEGEISNFSRAHSGHLYFDLKDDASQLRAVMWRSYAQRVPFEPENGQQVVCKGLINLYERRGQYQYQVEVMEPKGKGALQLAFEQLKEKLQKEGIFAPEHKKELPVLPQRLGIVTSPRGAAIIDILHTLDRRFARLQVLIYPVKVQGEGAAEEIVEGIDRFAARRDVDVIIVGRGGGSMEDLWAFNQEIVARAVFRCPIPVISAVGHEVDFTITDFVADIRASTPTAAAEMVIEKEEALRERIANFERRLLQGLRLAAQERRARVMALTRHRAFSDLYSRVLNLSRTVDELERRAADSIRIESQRLSQARSRARLLDERICSLMKARIQAYKARWEKLSSQLHVLSPLNVLRKGYSLCWASDGVTLLRSADDIVEGDGLTVSFYRGEFACRVNCVDRDRSIQQRLVRNASPNRSGPVSSDGDVDEGGS
jgi:exodeoxyribonuclease VII large subunit